MRKLKAVHYIANFVTLRFVILSIFVILHFPRHVLYLGCFIVSQSRRGFVNSLCQITVDNVTCEFVVSCFYLINLWKVVGLFMHVMGLEDERNVQQEWYEFT